MTTPTFRTRSLQPEFLDTEPVTDAEYALILADLATINTLTRTRPPTIAFLRRIARRLPPDMPLRVLDVGYGEGDMLRRIHRWGTRRGLPMQLAGIDLSPACAAAARAKTPAGMGIDYRTGDVFDVPPGRYDVVLSSQFTHHLTDPQVIAFLRWMEASATRGWFIGDLHRHALAYYGFKTICAVAGFHPVVVMDGLTSVTRSFRARDWRRLVAEAGVAARLEWHLPFRYCVSRIR